MNTKPFPLTALAWAAALLVSALSDIICLALIRAVPPWLPWAKLGLLGGLILLSLFWKPLQPLRPFFITLFAITGLMRFSAWVLETPAWSEWSAGQTWVVIMLAAQALEMGVALAVIGVLFGLRKRRQAFFLTTGDLGAKSEPVAWLGQRKPDPLWQFGLIFTGVVIVAQYFMFIQPYPVGPDVLRKFVLLLPAVLLLAALNGFTEETMLRAAPIASVYEVIGAPHALWIAAVLFGFAHYIGGAPSGIVGVLITTFLGWFFGKCMLESRGLFWPWFFHFLQDILPFSFMALWALSQG